MAEAIPIYRAPMRARDRDAPEGAGAAFGVAHDLVGTGDELDVVPATIDEAVAAAEDRHGEKAARMLRAFADLPDGTFVWTREEPGVYRLGRITGPWRYEDSPAARRVGIHHVRPARWLPTRFEHERTPPAVLHTFDRGGRNLQRTHDEDAEIATRALWDVHAPAA